MDVAWAGVANRALSLDRDHALRVLYLCMSHDEATACLEMDAVGCER